MKRVTLETGGKSPMVILNDADLDLAVKWVHLGIMSNAGQICSATSRILVQEDIYNEFITRFKKRVQAANIGDPFKDDTFQGPQVTRAQFAKVLSYIQSGKDQGATLALGGEAYKDFHGSKGLYIAPTVFTDVKDDMTIYREEVFGHFVVVCSFKTEAEALTRANDSLFGLGSAILPRTLRRHIDLLDG